ncbi:alpha-galactosidase [Lacticaseibacillus zeae]|uniref:Alpha-galactosidase n=1 Tax=Lacticaseibacillus zeae TaxID=57037 RepID=A0A5R8LNC8_LACZE|nr:alpha-galactosidase [Lacticaseibacillus zeae]
MQWHHDHGGALSIPRKVVLAFTLTRSPAQKPACKDLGRNDQERVITPVATYTPISKRSCSRSH